MTHDLEAGAAAVTAPGRSERTRAPAILVAEDDPAMRELIGQALREGGYEVVEAADGEALFGAIDAGFGEPGPPLYDGVVTDVRMPGRTGIDVLRSLREHDRATPVVLITAFGTPGLHEEAERLGACVLDKPFDLDDLVALVRRRVPPAAG